MLISSIKNDNPVIFFEHRWLHENFGNVPKGYYESNILKAKVLKGCDISLISNSFMSIECLKASKELEKLNVSCEVLDLRVLRPIDKKAILKTANKTKKI